MDYGDWMDTKSVFWGSAKTYFRNPLFFKKKGKLCQQLKAEKKLDIRNITIPLNKNDRCFSLLPWWEKRKDERDSRSCLEMFPRWGCYKKCMNYLLMFEHDLGSSPGLSRRFAIKSKSLVDLMHQLEEISESTEIAEGLKTTHGIWLQLRSGKEIQSSTDLTRLQTCTPRS